MPTEISVPLWAYFAYGAAWTALLLVVYRYGRRCPRSAPCRAPGVVGLDIPALTEETRQAVRTAIAARIIEQDTLSPLGFVAAHGAVQPARPYLAPPRLTAEPDPRTAVRPVVDSIAYLTPPRLPVAGPEVWSVRRRRRPETLGDLPPFAHQTRLITWAGRGIVAARRLARAVTRSWDRPCGAHAANEVAEKTGHAPKHATEVPA
jgi:hypothetical protein